MSQQVITVSAWADTWHVTIPDRWYRVTSGYLRSSDKILRGDRTFTDPDSASGERGDVRKWICVIRESRRKQKGNK